MKKAAIVIITSTLILTGCGSSGVNTGTSSTAPETGFVSAETETGIPGDYEYVGNSLQTAAEPIVLDRGYVAMLEDDLDEDGVDETIMLVTDSDGEIMDFDIEIYEPGKTGYELADTIHREMKCEAFWSQSEELPEQYRVFVTDHEIQLHIQNSDIENNILPYRYDGVQITEGEMMAYYWDAWRNENTQLLGSISYMGYVQGSSDIMQDMPTGYCMSLIDGTQMSTCKTDEYVIPYPKMWDEYITYNEVIDESMGYVGTTFSSKTLTEQFSEAETETPYAMFSVGVEDVSDYFDISGGRYRIWHGDTREFLFEDGGDWMAVLLGAGLKTNDTEELLKHHSIIEDAEYILPVVSSYTGTDAGQIDNPFVPDESGEEIISEEPEADSTNMEISGKDWKEAYLSVLNSEDYLDSGSNTEFALIYVDDDDIPEMVVNTNVEAGGCQIYTFHDGKGEGLQTSRLGFNYIEKGNLLCNSDGHMDSYYDKVFTISDGKWKQIGDGTYGGYGEGFDEETGRYICTDYMWNGEEVSIDEYMDNLESIYDFDKAVDPQEYYSGEEMTELLGA